MSAERTKWKRKAWNIFSIYIRLKYSDFAGYVECVTCGRKYLWNKGMQAGHFIPGRRSSILFVEHNVHPQCYGCNIGKKGNMVKYYKFMLDNYGQNVIDSLEELEKKDIKFTADDYKNLYMKYTVKIRNLGHGDKL